MRTNTAGKIRIIIFHFLHINLEVICFFNLLFLSIFAIVSHFEENPFFVVLVSLSSHEFLPVKKYFSSNCIYAV